MKKILFNDKFALTQAVLDGRKTQTRRIAYDFRKHVSNKVDKCVLLGGNNITYMDGDVQVLDELVKPQYHVGEVVAVAQSYKDCGNYHVPREDTGWNNKMFVKSILMPHRIRITDVRVERLQDISEDDCLAEGVVEENIYGDPEPQMYEKTEYRVYYYNRGRYCALVGNTPREAYAALIDKISGKGTFESNPYVFAYTFELVK